MHSYIDTICFCEFEATKYSKIYDENWLGDAIYYDLIGCFFKIYEYPGDLSRSSIPSGEVQYISLHREQS